VSAFALRRLPNIVVIAIDSLRADHLGCYGYGRPTSPAIDALAEESVVFDQAFAAGIPTMPSFTTLYTGLHPYRHGIVAHSGNRRLSDAILLLPQLAKERGYVTAACDNLVVQGEGRGSWFARGYDHYSGFLYRPFGDQSSHLTDRALGFIHDYADPAPPRGRCSRPQRPRARVLRTLGAGPGGPECCAPSGPLFLFLHYWDPHSPYGPLPPYDTLHYEPGSGPVDMAEVLRIAPDYYDLFLADMRLRHPDDYAYVVAQYDGEISQVDVEVGRIVAALKEQGCWDNTIVVLLSDHGECFGEGDFYFDHHGLYDVVTRVALLLRIPGQAATRIGALVSTEDILPTLAELVGLPKPPYELSGTSLLPLLSGAARAVRPHVILAESTRQASLALRTERWKLILPITRDAAGGALPDVYGRPRRPDPLLFDLKADPAERRNLTAEQPARLEEMLGALDAWRADMARITGEPDPIQAQGLSLSYAVFMQRLLARR
jgi:arylsulfatase A-like enzyme